MTQVVSRKSFIKTLKQAVKPKQQTARNAAQDAPPALIEENIWQQFSSGPEAPSALALALQKAGITPEKF